MKAPKPASTHATFAQRGAEAVFRTWLARKASTPARPAVLSAPQFATCAQMPSHAIVPSPNKFAACARISANGAPMNVQPTAWITANGVQRLVVRVPQHAAKWLPD